MRCRQIEKLLIEKEKSEISGQELAELDTHVSSCKKCASFSRSLSQARSAIPQIELPSPGIILIEKTLHACHQELRAVGQRLFLPENKTALRSVPRSLWIGLGVFLCITLFWSSTVMNYTLTEKVVSIQTLTVLMIIFQNILMLLFSPLILNWYRKQIRTIKSKMYLLCCS